MRSKLNDIDLEKMINKISLVLTAGAGVSGVFAGALFPTSIPIVIALQAGAYLPALVEVAAKGLINNKELSKKIEGQLRGCAEITAKEYLKELKVNRPTMYSLFRDAWENDGIYNLDPTMDSIEQNMMSFLASEAKWEGDEITPKDIDDVTQGYIQSFIMNMRKFPELNQATMLGIIQEQDGFRSELKVINKKVDGLSTSKAKNIQAFYEYINSEFSKLPKSDLYGKISLKEGYIEPTIKVDETMLNVREFLETWVESESMITAISGEPGHGKTSLCWKAMCDFYNNGWIADKVDNVFCFSLNPANTDALSNDALNLYKLLSWGNNRVNIEHVLDESDCKNALIFFDGYDELLEWHPGLSLIRFIEDKIIPFQEETGSHIVLTSRDMVIDPDINYYYLSNSVKVHINRLQPITNSQQFSWIESYIEKWRSTSPEKALELEEYLKEYKEIPEDDNLEKILGIPIIFRMIVEARYLPKESGSITNIYDELFHITWTRHNKKTKTDDELTTKKKLQDLALKIYFDNNDTTELENGSLYPWLFSFYTVREEKRRVGFLHRSFYQYFLAHEVLSWYRDCAEGKEEGIFRNRLSYLACRRLDKTTLLFIRELYVHNDDISSLKAVFDEAYAILKETDGFLPLPSEEDVGNKISSEKQIVRANNVFWNIVSIGSICGESISLENINIEALRAYDLSGGVFIEAQLQNADLKRTSLVGTDFSKADLSGAELNHAVLKEADFCGAKLRDANLRFADFSMADFSRADLRGALLILADFRDAYLKDADLRRADLREADFVRACFRGADLSNADLSRADLCDAWLVSADLSGANLGKADLNCADFSDAKLIGTDLNEADLRGIELSGTTIKNIKLDGAKIFREDADYLMNLGCDISKANIVDAW